MRYYWTKDCIGNRLVLTDGKLTFQSCALADQSRKTEEQWRFILRDRYERHANGGPQLDGVYRLSETLFQVA